MPNSIPRFSASSQAKRTSAHHSGVKATSRPIGQFSIRVAHGVQMSAMPKMVAEPMPTSLNQSRSLMIPSFVTFDPIQCHHTPVRARGGGCRNTVSGSGAATTFRIASASVHAATSHGIILLLLIMGIVYHISVARTQP